MRSVLFAAAIAALPVVAAAEEAPSRWTWGVAAGFPQTLAVTAERHGASAARLQLHAGTFFLAASSIGARMVLISPTRGFAPYAFFGGGVFHIAEGEGGDAVGATAFGWVGAGLRIPTGPLRWFFEIGATLGKDTGNGYESTGPAGAVGVSFGRK